MLPTPHTIQLKRWQILNPATPDAHGNPVESYAAPVSIPVHWIAKGAVAESIMAGRRHDEAELTVGAPAGTVVDARDLVIVGGVEHEVVGDMADWTKGPWPMPHAGVTFGLKRARG